MRRKLDEKGEKGEKVGRRKKRRWKIDIRVEISFKNEGKGWKKHRDKDGKRSRVRKGENEGRKEKAGMERKREEREWEEGEHEEIR